MKAVLLCLFALVLVASAQFCDQCHAVVLYAENYIEQNQTEQYLFGVIQPLCGALPSPYNTECASEINSEGPAIIAMIIAKEDPQTVCVQLSFCTSAKKPVKHLPVHKALAKAKAPLDNCATCETVVNFLEAFISENTTIDEVTKFLTGTLCPAINIPSDVCNVVASELPALVDALDQGLPPKQACAMISLCASLVPKKSLSRVGDVNCQICEFAVNQIEDYIASNATETEIEAALNSACDLLGSFSSQCKSVVAALPAYISQLENAETPAVICTQVGICTSSKKSARFHVKH